MRALFILGPWVAVALGWPISALSAEGPPKNLSQPENRPVRLQVGEVAPFEGMLVPLSIAAMNAARLEGCQKRVEAAREKERESAELKIDLVENFRHNDRVAFELQLRVLEKALRESEPGWWEHPGLWFGIGIVAAIAVVAGSVSILDATRPIHANLQN